MRALLTGSRGPTHVSGAMSASLTGQVYVGLTNVSGAVSASPTGQVHVGATHVDVVLSFACINLVCASQLKTLGECILPQDRAIRHKEQITNDTKGVNTPRPDRLD